MTNSQPRYIQVGETVMTLTQAAELARQMKAASEQFGKVRDFHQERVDLASRKADELEAGYLALEDAIAAASQHDLFVHPVRRMA